MKTYCFSFFKAVVSAACVSLFLAGCTANNPDSLGDGDDPIEVVTIESLNVQVKDINESLNEYKSTMNQLSSYMVELQNKVKALEGQGYTDLKSRVAALEGKLTAFENALKDLDGYTDLNTWVSNLNNGLNSLSTLQSAVNEAKASITDITTRLNGLDRTTANIAGDLDAKTKQLTDDLSKCSTDISGMMDRLAALENSVGALQREIAALISAVQSVVVVPDYADGSVKMKDGQNNVLRFEVYPTTAAQKLAEVGPSAFSLDCVETETKASIFTNIPIIAVSFDDEVLSVTADGSGLKDQIKDGTQPANARLRITDGKVTRSSEYFALTYKTSSGEPVSPDDPSGDFIGAYALDDGTGLTDTYFSFFKGTLSKYSLKQSSPKVVIAEGCLWHTSVDDFSMGDTGEYAIDGGTIYLKGVPYGAVSFSGNQMTLADKTYTRFTDFKSERYSVITVDGGLERTCDYTAQTLSFLVSLRTIPSGKLQAYSGSDWLVPGEYKDGVYSFSIKENNSGSSRSAQVTFSYLEAESVTLTLTQSYAASEINCSNFSQDCDYTGGTFSFEFAVSNPREGTAVRAMGKSNWITDVALEGNTICYTVSKNIPGVARTGTISLTYGSFDSKEFTVNQSPLPVVTDPTAANCYIISAAGTHSFKAVYGNTTAKIEGIASVDVLWESLGTSTAPSVGSVINNVSYSNYTVTFSTPATLNNGNAVIAAKDASGNILWSWHIWVCNGFDPAATAQDYSNSAGTMMDRNLGATSAEPGSVGALGLLYQWGRKDPFLGSSSISSNSRAKSTLSSWPSAVSSNSSSGTIEYAVSHPTTFIGNNSSNADWYYTGSSSTDNNRWKSSKTIYDPCPPGWRVPDGGISGGVWAKALGSSSAPTWDSTNRGMDFSGKFGSADTIWYPAAGYLNTVDGSLSDVGYSGRWRSCTPAALHHFADGLSIASNSLSPVSPSVLSSRAWGYSVRCSQE